MRAVTVAGIEAERRLALVEHDAPQAGPHEVLVAVKAVSLNNGEVRGSLSSPAGYRPGWDFAGVVEAGPGFAPGDRVFGFLYEGAWAERIAVPMSQLALIPDGLSFETASALPIAGLSAAMCLTKKPLGAGLRLLVTAATGGVGVLAIQLAASTGAHVTAFARNAADGDLLRRLGAHEVAVGIEAAASAGPYDSILEGVGGALLGHALYWLAPRGVCVQFGDAAGDELTTFDARRFRLANGGLFGGTMLYGFFMLEEITRPDPIQAPPILCDLAARVAAGTLDPVVNKIASWRDVDQIARALLKREFNGKAVLRVD